MYLIDSYHGAVLLSISTMVCWGSWPNAQKLTSENWRFELFYWDYVFGIFAASLVAALTMGMYGSSGRNFLVDIAQADWNSMVKAIIGGTIFNAGNILFVAAVSYTGMAVAFPVSTGFSLILGVVVNYVYQPLGNPLYMAAGVCSIICAIFLSASVTRKYAPHKQSISKKGILLSMLSALFFGWFYRFLADALATDFIMPESGKLTPYTGSVLFSVGIILSNLVFNTILMNRPIEGKPVHFHSYFAGKKLDHFWGLLGGSVWGIGLLFSLLAAGMTGYALAFGLSQGDALIASFWGVFVWKEFRNAGRFISLMLASMFVCFVLGILLLLLAKN